MRGYAGLTDVGWSGQANSFAASRDLAFLEGLERYAGHAPAATGAAAGRRVRELGDRALDPRTCGVYADRTYDEDPTLRRFAPAGRSPGCGGTRCGTTGRCWCRPGWCTTAPASPRDNFVFECSNGCATGSCLEEAVLFGLLELVERDAFLLGWYGDAG